MLFPHLRPGPSYTNNVLLQTIRFYCNFHEFFFWAWALTTNWKISTHLSILIKHSGCGWLQWGHFPCLDRSSSNSNFFLALHLATLSRFLLLKASNFCTAVNSVNSDRPLLAAPSGMTGDCFLLRDRGFSISSSSCFGISSAVSVSLSLRVLLRFLLSIFCCWSGVQSQKRQKDVADDLLSTWWMQLFFTHLPGNKSYPLS